MSERKLTTTEIIVILIIIALMGLFLLSGCNMKNVEYRRFNTAGQLVENVRMGQVNFGFWFGLNDLDINSKPLKVSVGSLTEYPDPNSVEAILRGLMTLDGLP